jgi:hypothetical protein
LPEDVPQLALLACPQLETELAQHWPVVYAALQSRTTTAAVVVVVSLTACRYKLAAVLEGGSWAVESEAEELLLLPEVKVEAQGTDQQAAQRVPGWAMVMSLR